MASVYARSCTLTYTFLLCRVEGTHVSDENVSCLVLKSVFSYCSAPDLIQLDYFNNRCFVFYYSKDGFSVFTLTVATVFGKFKSVSSCSLRSGSQLSEPRDSNEVLSWHSHLPLFFYIPDHCQSWLCWSCTKIFGRHPDPFNLRPVSFLEIVKAEFILKDKSNKLTSGQYSGRFCEDTTESLGASCKVEHCSLYAELLEELLLEM